MNRWNTLSGHRALRTNGADGDRKMKTLVLALVAITLALASPAFAQVHGIINYKGRVVVSGMNFTGTGQFKFALVDGSGTTTFWSNDGTATGEPVAPVSVSVTKGLYSVLLGQSPMVSISPTVFTNADVRLRVWFDGGNGMQQLTPDQRIGAVGFAMMAATVPGPGITGTIPDAQLGGVVNIDPTGINDGLLGPALTFGARYSGEGIASKRTAGGNQNGLDFYADWAPRMSISHNGKVGIGTVNPVRALQLEREMLIDGNDATGTEYSDWPFPSLSIRRSDDFVANGVTMITFGYRNDPLYLTDDSVANIRLYDPQQVPNAPTSTPTTQLRIASPGPLVLQPSGGKVGIGTASPAEQLDVAGAVKLGTTANPEPAAGTIRWTGTDFQGYNGQ